MRIKPIRITNYIENVVSNYNPIQFQQHFRVSIGAYENLVRIVGPRLKRIGNIGRHQIDIGKQIMAVLWILATPDSYRSVGERFDIGKSSISVCFMRVVKILNEIAPTVITWPRGERMNEVKQGFYTKAQIDNIVGVKYLDMNRTDLIAATVLASCVLHNVCLCYNDVMIEDYIRDGMDFVVPNDNEERMLENNMEEDRQRRDQICTTLFAQNQ